jgi:hypothetical protein
MMLAPAAFRQAPQLHPEDRAAAWQAPDPDELWEAAAVADLSTEDLETIPEGAALAALEE